MFRVFGTEFKKKILSHIFRISKADHIPLFFESIFLYFLLVRLGILKTSPAEKVIPAKANFSVTIKLKTY